MSSPGLKAAAAHGKKLPAFGSLAEAQTALMAKKDAAIARLLSDSSNSPATNLDFSVESLRRLEHWYFEQIVSSPRLAGQFSEACALYFGEVVARNASDAHWVVQEFAFERGRYEICVGSKLFTMGLLSFHEKLHHERKRKRDSMWRTYQCYFVPDSKVGISF